MLIMDETNKQKLPIIAICYDFDKTLFFEKYFGIGGSSKFTE
jgi:hypothetical protein